MVSKTQNLNKEVSKNVSDELGYDNLAGTAVEQQHGMSREYRPPFVLAPVVEQRIKELKHSGGLTEIYNPMTNYQHSRWTRWNLLDSFIERLGKEFSKETWNLFINNEIQSENRNKLDYALNIRPNKLQTMSNFLQEFAEHAYRNRKINLYLNKEINTLIVLPADLSDEHGNFISDGVTQQFQEEFVAKYGIRFNKKYFYYSKYTQAGRAHMSYPYFWVDLVGLLNAQHPKGVLMGRGRVAPTNHFTDNVDPRNTQEYERLNNLNRQFDETSTAFIGTDEKYQELFTNRVANAEQYLNNQLKMISLAGGFDDKILTGSWETEEEYQMFYRSHILPLVEFFCQTMTAGLFGESGYLKGNKITQNVLRTTPYDLGLIGQSTLVYDGRVNPNEIRARLGLSTDDKVLDKPLGNLNMRPLNDEYFEADAQTNALNKLKAETSIKLIKADPSLALESQRRTSISSTAVVQPDGGLEGIDPNEAQDTKQQAFKRIREYKERNDFTNN